MWFTTGALVTWCLCFMANQHLAAAQSWPEPELKDARTPDIIFEPLVGRFGLKMNEEIERPFTLVDINYNGTNSSAAVAAKWERSLLNPPGIGTPYVSRYNIGTRDNLQLSFERNGDVW